MKFMMLVKAQEGAPVSPELMAAVGKLTMEMAQAGVLLEAGGLAPTARGTRIRVSNAKLTVIDGPFTESKELIGGYAVLKADSREEAIELGRRFMQVHADVEPSFTGELEIREMHEAPVGQA